MIEVFLHIRNGEVVNSKAVEKALSNLSNGKYLLKITKTNQRSISQNRYYFGVVVPMVKEGLYHVGYNELSLTDVHEILKYKFLKVQIPNQETGEVLEFTNSTTRLSTVLFMDYIESIAQFASEYLGITIPQPNEQMQIDY